MTKLLCSSSKRCGLTRRTRWPKSSSNKPRRSGSEIGNPHNGIAVRGVLIIMAGNSDNRTQRRRLMNEWNIQSRAAACQACGKAFADQQPYRTLLFDLKQEI